MEPACNGLRLVLEHDALLKSHIKVRMIQQSSKRFPELSFVGIDGVLVRFGAAMSEDANRAALAFHRHITMLDLNGVVETAPSLTAVFLKLDIDQDPRAILNGIKIEMDAQDWFALESPAARRWTIPCSFDGPQLREAAELAGVTQEQAVDQITDSETRVLTLGFAPGQPYLGNLEPHWDIPRMTGIAANVPAQALVVALRQLIIFTNETPTGWRHIGQTAFKCFDKNREDPFAFRAGDLVRFARADRAEIDALQSGSLGGAKLEALL